MRKTDQCERYFLHKNTNRLSHWFWHICLSCVSINNNETMFE